jgi:hypothetical protein
MALVPAGATPGNVVVTVGGISSNGVAFAVTTGTAPSIASLNPTFGPVGTSVAIYGANFGASQGTSTVTFNGTLAAPASSWGPTSIGVVVPSGATPGNVVVTVGGVSSNGVAFAVTTGTSPSIASLSPTFGPVGTPMTITGANFGASQGTSTVTFNGTLAAPASSWGPTSIGVVVPSGATPGNVVVTVGGVASNGVAFTVSSGSAKWPIKASANGRYFIDATGAPWLMAGDSAHHIVNVLLMSSWPTYFASRQSLGFNSVNIFSCTHGNCPSTGATADGQLPFTSMIPSLCNGGASNPDYDLATPKPGYWLEIDQFINMAESYGLVVLINPLTTADYMNDMRTSGPTKAFNFGAFLGSRYKNNFPNIIWELGNDFQTWRNTTPACPGAVSDNTLVQQLMAGIASADPNHIQTIQLDYFRSYSNQDAAIVPYVKADGIYTYYETYDYALKAYNSAPVSPVFLTEANMEGANNTNLLTSPANGLVLRRQMYWTMTSGAAGHVWGNTHVNHSDLTGTTWQSQLNTPATLQVAVLTNLFTKYQWWRLVPDQTHQIVTSGFGNYSTTNENLYNSTYATTAWITDGSLSLTYVPSAATLTVAMSNFAGPTVTAQWYDPTNGTFTKINGSPFPNSSSQTFTTPGANSAGDPDWVLVLQ